MPLPSLRHHCPKDSGIWAATSGRTELQRQHWGWERRLPGTSRRGTEIVSTCSVHCGLANSVPELHYCRTVPAPHRAGTQVGEAYRSQCSLVGVRVVASYESLTCGTIRWSGGEILKAGVFLLTIFVPADRRPGSAVAYRRGVHNCTYCGQKRSTILYPRKHSANGVTG
jgi:hypothetical protein